MPGQMPRVDVLIVSLGGTAGLREADAELAASLRRAGATVEIARVGRARELRTFAAIEFAWAVNARRATTSALATLVAAGGDLLDHHGRASRSGFGRNPL